MAKRRYTQKRYGAKTRSGGSYSRGYSSSRRRSSSRSYGRRRTYARKSAPQTVKLVIEQVAPQAPMTTNLTGGGFKAAVKARL